MPLLPAHEPGTFPRADASRALGDDSARQRNSTRESSARTSIKPLPVRATYALTWSCPAFVDTKRDAIALVRRSGKSIAEVAVDLGVSGESLRKWEKLAKVDSGQGPLGALATEEREELRR